MLSNLNTNQSTQNGIRVPWPEYGGTITTKRTCTEAAEEESWTATTQILYIRNGLVCSVEKTTL